MKEKVIRASARGITFSDEKLFPIGTKVKYLVDHKAQQLVISPHIESDREITVSRKKSGEQYKPLVDIRSKEVLELFATADTLSVVIEDDVVTVSAAHGEEQTTHAFDKGELFDAAGIDATTDTLAQAVTVASFFSGAGAIDEAFKNLRDYQVVYALEKNEAAAATYRHNHGEHIVVGDICELAETDVPSVDVIIGGSPCQGFSNSNRRSNYLDNPNNLLLKEFLRIIKGNRGCKVFVLENVPQLLTAGEGTFLKEIHDYLDDFYIESGVLNAADFGTAQLRKRAFLIGSKIGPISLPSATVQKDEYRTVSDVLADITANLPNQQDVTKAKDSTLACMEHIPPGGNWRDLPPSMRGNKREGKTHSNILRRLKANEPSIALPNVRKSMILHPTENRVLSVRELARLFDLPDTFTFLGRLGERQQQLANAIPVRMAKALAKQVLSAFRAVRPSKIDALLSYIRSLGEEDSDESFA